MNDTTFDDKTPLKELGSQVIQTNVDGHLTFYPKEVRWWPRWFRAVVVHALAAARPHTILHVFSAMDEKEGGRIFLVTERTAILLTVSAIERDHAEIAAVVWPRAKLVEVRVLEAEEASADTVRYVVSKIEAVYEARAPLQLPLSGRWNRVVATEIDRLYGALLDDLTSF